MNRKNQVLDALSDTYEELDRLYRFIPEDTSKQYNLWLAIISKLKQVGFLNMKKIETYNQENQ